MKKIFFSIALFFYSMMLFAQKQEFGALSYTVPPGYTEKKGDDVLTYYKQNNSTGTLCIFFIYKPIVAKGTAKQCFDYYWESLVQKPNNISVAATMQPEETTKGWKFLSGNGTYTDKGAATAAMQITFTDGNKMQNVLILTNSTNYQKDIENFIAAADVIKEAGGAAANENTVSEKNAVLNTGNKSYDAITVPPTWSINTSGGKLMLEKNTPSGKRIIEFMSFIKSSCDLEKDMAHIFFEVFDGWELRIPGITLFTEATCEKGQTCQGLNYYMMSNSIKKKGPDNFDVIKATVLLIQAGDEVAIINTADNILGSEAGNALNFLLFNLKLKGITEKSIDYKKQLIGTWGTSSGLVSNNIKGVTTYTDEGKYYGMVEASYTTGYSYYYDLIKKNQFKNQGSFNFSKNVLERKNSSGAMSRYFIRFFSTKYGNKEWENQMGLYEADYDKTKISNLSYFHKIN